MRPISSHVSRDIFLHIPDLVTRRTGDTRVRRITQLVFFITGNPGLIGYYHEFLSLLVQSRQIGEECVVAGFSLGGFGLDAESRRAPGLASEIGEDDEEEDDDDDAGERLMGLAFPPEVQRKDVYGLKDQVNLSFARIEAVVRRLHEDFEVGNGHVEVLLVGHSVGAYIALEIVRIWHERYGRVDGSYPTSAPDPSLSTDAESKASAAWTPTTAILLTPTIIDIAKSSSGKVATPLLSYIPYFPELLQLASRGLTIGLAENWVCWVVGRITGMQEGAALRTTTAFLRSSEGVRQALHLARDEMLQIGGDGWGKEVWGVAGAGEERVDGLRLYFWFAKRDHWVADVTRQQILEARACIGDNTANSRGSRVIVDETEGLVHAWCLKQSPLVAERVGEWIIEILENGK